ncbi:MAG TPA: 4a-hydroxytetrahydrobiopterin dehydratase [Chloroflexota bacterium]|nr:4a-hydroxytetrahydrobiopterin dehydratase [Chloroflexota bacterium]
MTFSEDQVRARLSELDGWSYDGKDLVRLCVFPSFMDAIRFVGRVAEAAESANHHPNIDIRYDSVRLAVHTHSENGVTERDFALAKEIDRAINIA